MKIHADKIEGTPPHAIRVKDLRAILAALPSNWTEGISEVRLSNSQELRSWAFFSRYDGTLTIYSRRGSAKEALIATLSELAACVLGLATRRRHRRSDRESHRILPLIQPYIDRFLPTLEQTRPPLDSPGSSFKRVN